MRQKKDLSSEQFRVRKARKLLQRANKNIARAAEIVADAAVRLLKSKKKK